MSKCRSCGAEVIWVYTKGGRKMPLSVESAETRFVVRSEGGATESDTILVAKSRKTYVSHFADCPDAEKWRSG